ncbi:(+)-delta-cadinene synthase [Heracleum sosnowskyi]|uniref:(+)-delta-cadinene synthase n=1 Tax=Heracleum sosnowskyi TaxID=360622 RepID=A0AAD8MGX5_9APIA|nr:(+)-delta-cadinene synthase [Heracleum sosnowskyi]
MDSKNGGHAADDHVSIMQKTSQANGMASAIDQSRRTANYKPNVWNYDLLEGLTTEYPDQKYDITIGELIEEVKCLLSDTVDTLEMLEHIERLEKLGLAHLFEHEIKKVLDTLASVQNLNAEKNLYTTALWFLILRKHGYHVSQDMFMGLLDISTGSDVEAVLKLFEASYFSFENENILDQSKEVSRKFLESMISSKHVDTSIAKNINHTLEDPYNVWFNVKRHIQFYEENTNSNPHLVKLAKHNFNMLQAIYQKEVQELARWWRMLDLETSLPFLRNRIIESYVCAVGIVFEPKYGSLRKWLAKTIILILVLDDVYDVYGSLEELENFTSAVDRWDYEGTQTIPECMRICLRIVYDTTKEIASEIENETGWTSVSSYLQQAWINLCKSLLVEAKWFNKEYTPSLKEYTDNGWYSSSGPLLSIYIFFGLVDKTKQEEATDLLKSTEDHEKNVALVFRLCNDLGKAERGDASSSVQCIMQEKGISEQIARNQIKSIIANAWKKINYQCVTQSPVLQPYLKHSTNIARVAHAVYHNGDGVTNADGITKNQVMDLLSEPFSLNS